VGVSVRSSQEILCFSDFEVDLRSGELRKHGIRIKLQVQPFHVLRILLEHPGEVVTREELQKRIWPADTFVDFDQGLNNAVKKLREALGDDAEKPRFIETLSKRGYRFIVAVHNGAANGTVEDTSARGTGPEMSARVVRKKRFAWGYLLGAALAVALAVVLGLNTEGIRDRLLGKRAGPRIQSLAVLPLQNLTADPAQEYFSDGMTDALITDLAQIGGVKVISRTSSMQYKQTKKSLPEIARELNVEGIVEGTVQHSGDRVRITVQLLHGPSDRHIWAKSYERDMRDVFALERDVTEDITRQVQAQLATPGQRPLPQPRPVDPKVLEAYLQGNYHLSRYGEGSGQEEQKKAAEYFQQAIEADPNFAPAYVGLASAHKELLRGSSEDIAIRKKSLEKALELDPNDSEARAWLGFLKWQPFLDWQGAEAEFRQAIALSPNNAEAHHLLGLLLVTLGRVKEGLRESQIAQQLDPNYPHMSMSLALYLAHDYDGSIAMLRMMLQRDPNNGELRCYLSSNYTQKGMLKEAVQELEQCYSLFGLSRAAANIRHAYAVAGYRGARQQWAKELENLQATKHVFLPGNLADAYTILGERDRAFYWLEQAYQHREMVSVDGGVYFLPAEPMYDPLRSDPRYKDLLRRIGLPP
jgi:TolB-like protein/DNA-binding winged helix-turn-helix (wHTH) protein/tetratricopeptide (TPR) repeat protein